MFGITTLNRFSLDFDPFGWMIKARYDLSYDPMKAPATANGESPRVVRKSREQTTKISKQQVTNLSLSSSLLSIRTPSSNQPITGPDFDCTFSHPTATQTLVVVYRLANNFVLGVQAPDHCHQAGEVNQAIDSTRPFSRLPEVNF